MVRTPYRCLILACGNTLRSDDGLGPRLAEWAEQQFLTEPAVRVLSRQQWTPELAEDIAAAESVLFIDCSAESAPGLVKLAPLSPPMSRLASPRITWVPRNCSHWHVTFTVPCPAAP